MNDNRSVQRCLALLRSFRNGPNQSLSDLSKAIDLPHSTVLRFLNTLEKEGYVRKEQGLWSLAPQILEIGFAALENMGLTEFIQTSLQQLADTFSGSVNIGEKNKNEVIIIARAIAAAERRKFLIVNLRVGSSLPKTSSLFSALDTDRDTWSIVNYPERKTVSVAISIFAGQSRSLSLGLSIDIDDYPPDRIETEVVPLLRKERQQIERLMHLGPI